MFTHLTHRARAVAGCASAMAAAWLSLSTSVSAQGIMPLEYSNPAIGSLYYETENCRAEVETSPTLKYFDRPLFERLLEHGRAEATAVCTAAAAEAPLEEPYHYVSTWRLRAIVRSLDLIALAGYEFRRDSEHDGVKTTKSIVYDRAAARALELEDLFMDRELMLGRIVPLARQTLALQKQVREGVTLDSKDLEALLPIDLSSPDMQWGIHATSKASNFKGIWLAIPKDAFASVNGKDLRGRIYSGYEVITLDHTEFADIVQPRYVDAFADDD